MQQAKSPAWTEVVDDKRRLQLLTTSEAAYENACAILGDALTLFNAGRLARTGALAILAEEEFAKAFVLCICAGQRRWDSAIFHAIVDHGAKQSISQAMLAYWEWLEPRLRNQELLNKACFVPIRLTLFPPEAEWENLVKVAQTDNQKKRRREKLKQRFLYVSVAKNGNVAHQPSALSKQTVSDCLAVASTFKTVTEHALRDQIPDFKPNDS